MAHPRPFSITPYSIWALGGTFAQTGLADNAASAVWPAADRTIFIPFRLPMRWELAQIGWQNGATVTGNMTASIYSKSGIRLYTTGATAMSGANVLQMVDATDEYFDAGVYYMGLAGDSATNCTVFREIASSARVLRYLGMAQDATNTPATATFAAIASSFVPMMVVTAVATI